jgi:hypothetical protein
MLSSITPLGERSRRQHFWITAPLLALGATGAGAWLGAVLGAIGARLPLADRQRFLALAIAAALGLVADLLLRQGVPSHLRQVDESWLRRYRGWVYGLGFGLQLGVGLATVVTTSAVYLTILGEALAPSAVVGATIGAIFGGIRGASVLLAFRIDTPARLVAFHRGFSRLEPLAGRVTLAAQALIAVVAVAALL